jgi:cytoskeleton protein RodZ
VSAQQAKEGRSDDARPEVYASLGVLLKEAREARNLSIGALAATLKLDHRTLERLESDSHDAMPPPAFVRGYLRSIARVLDCDEVPLLHAFDASERSQEPEIADFKSRPPSQISSEHRSVRYATIGIGLGLFVLVLVWWWGDDQAVNTFEQRAAALEKSLQEGPPELPEAELADAHSKTEMATEAAAIGDESLTELLSVAQSETSDLPATAIDDTARMPASGDVQAASKAPDLKIRALERAWIDVTDAAGKRLYFDLLDAGREISLTGAEPYVVVLGNAAFVEVVFLGEVFDFAPFSVEGVARFTLRRPEAPLSGGASQGDPIQEDPTEGDIE